MDSGGFLLPGSGLVKRPDPLALKLVTVECFGQHQSFALKIGSQELIPWTLDGQRAVCPGWAAPWQSDSLGSEVAVPLLHLLQPPKVGLSQVTASHLELASETIVMKCYELRWIQQVAMGKRLVYSYVVSMDLKWWPIDPSWSIPTSILSHSYHIFFDCYIRSRFGMLWSNSDSPWP